MSSARARVVSLAVVFSFIVLASQSASGALPRSAKEAREAIGLERGICAILGLPHQSVEWPLSLARETELVVYVQCASAEEAARLRGAASDANLLGKEIFVGEGAFTRIGLATNLAGAVLVSEEANVAVPEILRVLHPGGKAIGNEKVLGAATIVKPVPDGVDSWSHPYRRPDNNPQSTDRIARAPYRTQFLADPKFCPMPEISVAAGGRVFRAFGHIAHKANQNAMLNKLICVNAYNGTILWTRDLSEGFMIHRNTLIATPEHLFLGDQRSLKLIDATTGKVAHEIIVPKDTADGPVWKWMGISGGKLYALVGAPEVAISTKRSNTPGLGHWPWGMWDGHKYGDPRSNFGFGRNFIAIDLATRKIEWNHREKEHIDSRGVCMQGDKIYFWSPLKHLACLDTKTQKIDWRNSDKNLLAAIGKDGRAQHYVTGYATTTFIKCSENEIFFAGPQPKDLVAASTTDGSLLWTRKGGNLQLVLRDKGLFAAGPGSNGVQLNPGTGEVLGRLPTRRACTRATGSVDSIFYRTTGGTVRLDVDSNSLQHVAPMRPPCQDGVIISDGYLYWGPWMCGCQLSLYGHIALGSREAAAELSPPAPAVESGKASTGRSKGSAAGAADWPAYRGGNARRDASTKTAPKRLARLWEYRVGEDLAPTAPIAVGDRVYFGDRSGAVHCVGKGGQRAWKVYTGGSIFFPPAYDSGRLFIGSADGWLYCLDAASGDRLWRYRVAPEERRIPVYGNLISTWPLAGGVAVHEGIVYAAAGIAHYDGTHVVAIDAASGSIHWHNGSSGSLAKDVDSGVSLQGALAIRGGELHFAGGGRQRVARFDLTNGRCLNTPRKGVTSSFQTAFTPYFPDYAQFTSCRRDYANGTTLSYDASYEGSRHSPLMLLAPQKKTKDGDAAPKPKQPSDRRRGRDSKARRRGLVWSLHGERYNHLVTTPDAVVAAGERDKKPFLAVVELESGKRRAEVALSSSPVKGGTAIDRRGRVVVSLRDGVVECYGDES